MGTVEDIIYRNEDNGYTVFCLGTQDSMETVVGTFALLREGESITVEGEFSQHPNYGMQLKATQYQINTPQGLAEIESYLASGIIKGIGPSVARAIVDHFGEDALTIIGMSPQRLNEIRGIGPSKVQQITDSFQETYKAQETVMFLQKFHVTSGMALRIYAVYGQQTIAKIQENPYALVNDVEGIGFLTADKIAQSMGLSPASAFRLHSGMRYCLTEAGNDGHTYLPVEELLYRAQQLLGAERTQLEDALQHLSADQGVVLRDIKGEKAAYHPSFYFAEAQAAGKLLLLLHSISLESRQDLEQEIADFEKQYGITLAAEQRRAADAAINSGICVITGGPGTGKTTTLNCIISLFRRRGKNIVLAAPTGRAAKRMTEASGEDAKTIHRLLEYTRSENGYTFRKNKNDPLECDVCIIDETSMVDIFLMNALLDGLPAGTRLVLVGDADQLPSVGPGNVLGDIIDSGVVPVVRLTEIFRQAAQSMIVMNAHRINKGQMPLVNTADTDFFLERKNNEQDMADTVLDLCVRRLPEHYGVDGLKDIQVLTPIKKGICGVYNLNKLLQRVLNPPFRNKNERQHGDDLFRQGDKVMQIRNNYQREWTKADASGLLTEGVGVFNGDVGIISEIDTKGGGLAVLFDDNRSCIYEFNALDELTLAYAISVHKSQGCEFRLIVMPLPMAGLRLMTRNLFYTAVTRARETVVLVGSAHSVEQMVRNDQIIRRYSALDLRLKDAYKLL